MFWVFLDASALTKRYAQEPGTTFVNEVFLKVPPEQRRCVFLGLLEVFSILVRKRNSGKLSQAVFDQAVINFTTEMIDQRNLLAVSTSDQILLGSLDLIRVHNLNATDAIVLRAALDLQHELRLVGD